LKNKIKTKGGTMKILEDKIIEIFCNVDDFCENYDQVINSRLLNEDNHVHRRKRTSTMSVSEVITIMIYFHFGCFRNFKHFYLFHIKAHMTDYFPNTVSYNRFVELMQKSVVPMTLFLKLERMGTVTGISFMDSTVIKVCKNQRIHNNRVFVDLAERGKGSMGWFYGFKLHLIVNDRGELLSFFLTPGNVDDRDINVISKMTKKLWGKIFADRGYISKTLFEFLFMNGIQLITKIRSNMKNTLMSIQDKILLRKRAIIESVNDELKNICQIEHSRHRSAQNFFTNLISGLIAYTYFDKKPSIQWEPENPHQLNLFYA
jgi:hypothetical protein